MRKGVKESGKLDEEVRKSRTWFVVGPIGWLLSAPTTPSYVVDSLVANTHIPFPYSANLSLVECGSFNDNTSWTGIRASFGL